MPKLTSIRLEDEDAEQLELLARIEGVSVSDEIREAIRRLIMVKRGEPSLAAQVARFQAFIADPPPTDSPD